MATVSRHRSLHLLLLGLTYLVICAGTLRLTRFDNGVAFLWIATALLTARLTLLPMRRWTAPLAVCALASMTATSFWGFGPQLAVPLAAVNMMEAAIGAAVLRRLVPRRTVLESQRWLAGFAVATGVIAPSVGAVLAGVAIGWATDLPAMKSALDWYTGHAFGTLSFMPIFMLVMRGDAARLIKELDRSKLAETCALIALVAIVTFSSFAQDTTPLLFLPVLPIVLATFRGGPLSTAASVVILAVVGGVLTLQGHGPIAQIDAPMGTRMQYLQFYVACVMLTVLPASAELQQRANLIRKLRESEARYRVLTENSTDIVINLDQSGYLQFASASIEQISGFKPEQLVGRPGSAMLHAADWAHARSIFKRIIAEPGRTHVDEFRAIIGSGDMRWLEAHSRAVVDDAGRVTGVASAIRDVSDRKAREERLTQAALTDALTGLPNRRGLDEELKLRLSSSPGGCVALFDLDHFKHINDVHGHVTGDAVLRHFAALARASVRDQDLVARFGGEEFAVVLPDATLTQATQVCDRLRRAVAESALLVNQEPISITVSGGVAPYRRDQPPEDILRAADQALYRAKGAGRDQLALAA